jgi:hypothetical protein
MTTTTENQCPSTSDNLTCSKPLYHATNGEYWDHAGGHIFTTPEINEALNTMHYDAGALLSGQPVEMLHKAEDCDYQGVCAWRKNNSF